jgi:hypothetical protein
MAVNPTTLHAFSRNADQPGVFIMRCSTIGKRILGNFGIAKIVMMKYSVIHFLLKVYGLVLPSDPLDLKVKGQLIHAPYGRIINQYGCHYTWRVQQALSPVLCVVRVDNSLQYQTLDLYMED